MSSKVKDFFEVTENYLHKDFGVTFRKEIIHKEVGKISGKNILDIGCGNGSISMPYVLENELTLLDFSENMLSLAKKMIPSSRQAHVALLNKDFFELDAKENYDTIFFIGVIAHVQRPLGESLRFLKQLIASDGEIYFQFTDDNHWLSKLESKLRKTKYEIKRTTTDTVETELKKCGLYIKKKIRYAGITPGMGKLPNSFLLAYVRIVSQFNVLNFLKAEYIYVLRKDS
ncbi:MAG: class I SAM-dependent methyltransferase [Saprospiraceae bacterium]|nr:class I SAM-dependent methyltransferase [Saprospiraceae bacterium]